MKKILLFLSFLLMSIGVCGADVKDVLTSSDFAATSTVYTDFSNVSKASDATYAGQTAKDNSGNIQLRSKNSNSGVVSTTSGGTVKSVKITVGSGSNTVDVYGSNVPYTSASDLYGSNKGTKIGSVTSTGTITFTGNYTYVGIRSNNGAIYLSSIEITWETGSLPSYTITAQSNNNSYGTVSLSGSVITGSAESCCQYASPAYSVTSGTATVSQNGNEFTVTPSSNCAIQINFEAKPKYTISFNNAAGTNPSSIQQSTCDESITLPTSAQISDMCSEMGWTFAGWTTKSSGDLSSSDLVGSSFTPTKDTTLYAVFKKIEGGSGESAYVVFQAPGGGDSGTERTSDSDIKNEVVDEYDGISTFSGSKLYDGGSGAKLGSNSYSGYITMNLSSPITTNQITVEASQYSSDGGYLHVEVNGSTSFGSDILPSTGTCVFTNATNVEITSVTISTTTKRAYLQSVTIGEGGTTDYSFNPVCETVHVDTVTLPVDTIRIHVGETYELTPTIIPSNATNKNIGWLSANESIATVENGVVTAVSEGITYAIVYTEDGNKAAACVVIVLDNPNIDVVEWNPDWLKIDVENFVAATAILEDQNIQADIKENVATELFFSKYFEAESTIKLLGLFNGTKDSIDLGNYVIKTADGKRKTTWDKKYNLSNIGWIHSNEEIILYSYTDAAATIVECIESKGGFKDYIRVHDDSIVDGSLTFNGDDAIGLFKINNTSDTTLIDIIGAGDNNSICIDSLKGKDGTDVIYGHTFDQFCWVTNKADSSGGFSDVISTNLCLLIRKSCVHSGDSAVKYNKTDFTTLPVEWIGLPVAKKDSSTCKNFDYVGTFDYAEHYVGFDTIFNEHAITASEEDGYYQINIPQLDTLACTNLKIIVKDVSDNEIEEVVKIPIMVKTNTTTTDNMYFDKKDCYECDVVVLAGKKLTVAGTSSENRDLKLYEGALLTVPNGTSYTLNSLALRRNNDSVSALYIENTGTLNLDKLYFDLYITPDDWHYVTLPDSFKLSDVKLSNGKKANFNEHYLARYYDGEYRSQHLTNGWKTALQSKKFAPGEGIIFGLTDDYKRKEFRFELNTNVIGFEKSSKAAGHMQAWGCENENLKPNHKGWNLVGNPYLSYSEIDITTPIRIGYLYKDETSGHWNGQWLLDSTSVSGKLRYAIIPSKDEEDQAAGGYKSIVLDDVTLKPFTCFFVQVGGTNESEHKTLTFSSGDRVNKIVARNKSFDEDEELFLRIKIDKWKTGCFISNKFSDEYEPGDDLESFYPVYQNIGGYKLLYSAIPDSTIEKGILINSPSGKIFLDDKVNINNFEYIYVKYGNSWYNLLEGETVDIESGSFILQAKRKKDGMPTGFDLIPTKGIYKFTDGKYIYINKNGELINVLGNKIK